MWAQPIIISSYRSQLATRTVWMVARHPLMAELTSSASWAWDVLVPGTQQVLKWVVSCREEQNLAAWLPEPRPVAEQTAAFPLEPLN